MYDVTVVIRVECGGGHAQAVTLVSEAIAAKSKQGENPEDRKYFTLQVKEVTAKQAKG